MNLYMVELAVWNWGAAVVWYQEVLGLELLLRADADGFALLRAGGGRIALKQARSNRVERGTDLEPLLVFAVEDLAAILARLACHGVAPQSPAKVSPEGYRRAIIQDPEGHQLCLFQWTTGEQPPVERLSSGFQAAGCPDQPDSPRRNCP
jgi:predicted enzyme related to lactoylglutathione lyase